MDNNKYTYTQVQKLRKTAVSLEDMENSSNPFWRLGAKIEREKMKPYVDEAYNKGQSEGHQAGFYEGNQKGFADGGKAGINSVQDHILAGMAIGAPVGAVAGTGISALLLRKDMSNAKKLAILLAGAGVGGAAGAGIGGAVSGLSV